MYSYMSDGGFTLTNDGLQRMLLASFSRPEVRLPDGVAVEGEDMQSNVFRLLGSVFQCHDWLVETYDRICSFLPADWIHGSMINSPSSP
jgi:hypothetical protein